jgi:hypothetical protein
MADERINILEKLHSLFIAVDKHKVEAAIIA